MQPGANCSCELSWGPVVLPTSAQPFVSCSRQAILEQSGIAAAVDFSKRRTPGAKFSFWEAQGVLMRLEVGVREAAAGTACVWLNATYSHLLPGVLDSLPFETQSGRGLGATGELRLAGQRLHGVQASSLPELCRRLLEGFGLGDRHRHLCHSSKKECFSPGVVVHGMHVVSAEGSVGTVAMPSSLCPKLHLPDKCRGLCVAHLRWLAGAGMPCHCGTELHVSSSELKAMVASAVKERSGGSTKVKVSTWAGGPREEDEAGRQAGPAVVVVGGLVVCKPAELLVQLEEAFSAFGLVRGKFLATSLIMALAPLRVPSRGSIWVLVITTCPASQSKECNLGFLNTSHVLCLLLTTLNLLGSVHGGKAKGSFRHGWARVYVDSMDNARRAAEALNGRLVGLGSLISPLPLLHFQRTCVCLPDAIPLPSCPPSCQLS